MRKVQPKMKCMEILLFESGCDNCIGLQNQQVNSSPFLNTDLKLTGPRLENKQLKQKTREK